ncbi:hypothetical protein MAPG_10408 [Magnaporthiopsis poae ATCC 64411]|uniref:GST N-terminal domain-containing protein n=1 Tax=Magnaporthiopsis poae (strain ATCC 64411 / 73-15) TaxID=644358 RepID=A0A0C4ECI2_MAGP6|nr:hypothetical protein MAPG_10408 [Magnaporthiopsis poae ATCC 64411]
MDATIKFYTNHGCPFAHRVHIALAELGIPFEEVVVDLSKPKTAEFLALNPAGLVPTLLYQGEHVITESAIIAQVRMAAHTQITSQQVDTVTNLLETKVPRRRPARRQRQEPTPPPGRLARVRARPRPRRLLRRRLDLIWLAYRMNEGIRTRLEPLLAGAAPFFGGSPTLTMAEVMVAPFALRIFALPRAGVMPSSVIDGLEDKAPNFYRWAHAVMEHPSVRTVFEKGDAVEATRARVVPMRGW